MAMTLDALERALKTALPDAQIDITDLRGDGDHYAAHIVSPQFAGKTRIEQHRIVYDALGEQGGMGDALHALSLKTSAP